jgi:hypothetical protein
MSEVIEGSRVIGFVVFLRSLVFVFRWALSPSKTSQFIEKHIVAILVRQWLGMAGHCWPGSRLTFAAMPLSLPGLGNPSKLPPSNKRRARLYAQRIGC